jgi:hypothetical protein
MSPEVTSLLDMRIEFIQTSLHEFRRYGIINDQYSKTSTSVSLEEDVDAIMTQLALTNLSMMEHDPHSESFVAFRQDALPLRCAGALTDRLQTW